MAVESSTKKTNNFLGGKGAGRGGSLRLQSLTKIFETHGGGGQVAAVDGVSLDIPPNQMVTLLGPSGCGKTTTLRIIAGFEQASSGKVWLEDKDITNQPANRREMAMVFQSYALFPHMSVFENIAYGLKVQKTNREDLKARVAQAMKLTELTQYANRQPNQLSGGQQQRVALARAIVIEPKVLLFDEPLSNLDAKLREQMRVELRRIQQELGVTGVYVTHDQAEAMTISDLVVVMNKGRIEQAAAPREIYQRPASRFVAAFIGKASFLAGKVREVQENMVVVEVLGQSWRVFNLGGQLQQDQDADLVIRPEGVILGHPGEQPLEGRITLLSYLGPVIEYEITLNGGAALAVTVSVLGQEWLPGLGEAVSVGLVETALAALPG
jgi:iron(III) transport system ATP-binding protein